MQETTRNKGRDAEDACCDYLIKQGLSLIEKNFHCRHGEIDLIMKDGKSIIFIEVRYRKNNHYGGALESITPAKQKKVKTTAETYIQVKSISNAVRIDVVAMSQNRQEPTSYSFDWIKNAF